MNSYKVREVWKEHPDFGHMARSLLDLLLRLEAEGRLDEVLHPRPKGKPGRRNSGGRS